MYDLLIVGFTPASAAAALRACRAGLSSLVVSVAGPGREPHLDWLGPAGVGLCQVCGLDAPALGATEFSGLRLLSWDLKRSTLLTGKDLYGWIVDRAALCAALLHAAEREGAEVLPPVVPKEVVLGEQCVTLRWADGEVRGRILLIADGLDSPTAALARMPTARRGDGLSHLAWVTLPGATTEAGLGVAIGARRFPQTVTLLCGGGKMQAVLVTRDATVPPATQLIDFLAAAREAKLIPEDPTPEPTVGLTPAGLALDMETLVGKRCLLIGEAAGFVATFSNESIYPAMKSGWIAAESVAAALQTPVLQDAMLAFSVAWRAELACYLRMPNTDLGLLMPLIFNNPQMAARLARAFLLGQSF